MEADIKDIGLKNQKKPSLRNFHSFLVAFLFSIMEEIWKPIKGCPDYEISNFGRVKSLSRKIKCAQGFRTSKERILKLGINKGYGHVSLYCNGKTKPYKIHQLVAIAFLNHTPCGLKLVVNHKDFNKLNNHVDNLEIVTQRENTNKKHLNSKSKYIGVYCGKGENMWRSYIFINGKLKYIGKFKTEIEAHNAYQDKLKQLI